MAFILASGCCQALISIAAQLCAYLLWPMLVLCTAISIMAARLRVACFGSPTRPRVSKEAELLLEAVKSLHHYQKRTPQLLDDVAVASHSAAHGERAFLFCTPRLCVRPFCQLDAEEWCGFLADADVWQYIRQPKPRQEALEFLRDNIRLYLQDAPCGRFRVSELATGDFVGCVGVLRMDDGSGVHVGYALRKQFWGRGYAQELVLHARSYFLGTGMVGQTIYAQTNPKNAASEHVLYRTGFTLEGSLMDGEIASHLFSYHNTVPGGGSSH